MTGRAGGQASRVLCPSTAHKTPRAIERQSPPELNRKKAFPSALMYLVGMSARSPEPQLVGPHPLVLVPPGQALLPLENTSCQGPQRSGETRTINPPWNRVPASGTPGVGS